MENTLFHSHSFESAGHLFYCTVIIILQFSFTSSFTPSHEKQNATVPRKRRFSRLVSP